MDEKVAFSLTELDQFIGTINWYRHPIVKTVFLTDGALYLAQKGKAFWLIDEIALAQKDNEILNEESFQTWILTINKNSGLLRCEDGNQRRLLEKAIPYTDFPEPGIELYFSEGIILLPSEY